MALGECSLDRILEKIPRPNLGEMPELYRRLDDMARRIGRVLAESAIFDKVRCVVEFDKADAEAIRELIERDPEVMVPFFVMLCGLSDREFERLHGIRKVYELGRRPEPERLGAFAHVAAVMLYRRYKRALEKLQNKRVYVAEAVVECRQRLSANGELYAKPIGARDLTFFANPRYRVLVISEARRIVVRCGSYDVLEVEGEEVPLATAKFLVERFHEG